MLQILIVFIIGIVIGALSYRYFVNPKKDEIFQQHETITDLDNSQTNKAFEYVYEEAIWGKDEKGNGTSGYGSTIEFNKNYIQFIRDFIVKNKVKSVVDIGCGDWQFSDQIYHDLDIKYEGYDCVEHLINEHKKRFSEKSNYHFYTINGDNIIKNIHTANPDLIILKDVIQHWTNENIVNFFNSIHTSLNFKTLLLTNDHTSSDNVDIKTGQYRRLNLDKEPFITLRKKFLFQTVFEFNSGDGKTTFKVTKL